ncbi:terminase small subunit [Bacillus cereus group sp. BY9-3LC]|uniref:terminase small subunit n=1 Tax=Bacillus cereus group sp. BY9-3LC TaxID=3018075 RepID=UPI0022E17121|nr:terminase small subunit [Bacillus cereus group sp. BY9-3LC]MDA1777463.1 terminase small subunit [Bacillus cereus group sp. BY9-3LC]
MNEHGLNERQLRFADLYIELGNASEAYRQAGYEGKNESTINATASNLLRNPKVKLYIDSRLSKAHEKRIADGDEVLATLTAIMRGERTGKTLRGVGMGEQVISDIEPSIGEITKAAELLGKRHRLFTEQVDLNANVGVTIVDDVDDGE